MADTSIQAGARTIDLDRDDLAAIELVGVEKAFTGGGHEVRAVEHVHLRIAEGEFFSLLGPLADYDHRQHGDLVASLRAFLEHNGNWEAAARALGVHRHTLRYRIRRVAELTGRDLEAAADRVEFWLALQAADVLRGRTERTGS